MAGASSGLSARSSDSGATLVGDGGGGGDGELDGELLERVMALVR